MAMKFEKLKRAKMLMTDSAALKNIISMHKAKLGNATCDKHALKFGGDSRFSVFKVNVFLDCHHGYYGISSCSTLTSIDKAIAESALNKTLNKHMALILDDMAEFARIEAEELIDDAKTEIEQASAFVDSIAQSVSDIEVE